MSIASVLTQTWHQLRGIPHTPSSGFERLRKHRVAANSPPTRHLSSSSSTMSRSLLRWCGRNGTRSHSNPTSGTAIKTDHTNLTYINVTLTGKVLRWKLYLQDKDFHLCHVPGKEVHQAVPDALSRLCDNHMTYYTAKKPAAIVAPAHSATLAALQPVQRIPQAACQQLARVHNSTVGHWGLTICKRRLDDATFQTG